jgi:hypothetical protein
LQDVTDKLKPRYCSTICEMEVARPPLNREHAQRRRKVGREARVATLVINKSKWSVSSSQTKDELHHIVSVLAADPRCAGNRCV